MKDSSDFKKNGKKVLKISDRRSKHSYSFSVLKNALARSVPHKLMMYIRTLQNAAACYHTLVSYSLC